MPVQHMNPDGITKPESYWQVAVATGSRTIYIAGQTALDENSVPLHEGDLAAQTERVYRNLVTALKGAGATFADVTFLTVYVVNLTPEKRNQYASGAQRAAKALNIDLRKPSTLLGVTSLARPAFLIEIDAIAVLP